MLRYKRVQYDMDASKTLPFLYCTTVPSVLGRIIVKMLLVNANGEFQYPSLAGISCARVERSIVVPVCCVKRNLFGDDDCEKQR